MSVLARPRQLTPAESRQVAAHRARLARLGGLNQSPVVYKPPAPEPPPVVVEPEPEMTPKKEYVPWFRIIGRVSYTIRDIQEAVSEFYGVERIDLISARRTLPIVTYRQIAMYLAKSLTRSSFPQIGRQFGGRDHSTALHAVRKIERRMISDEKLRSDIDQIKFALEMM